MKDIKKKRKFNIPHSLVIIVLVMILASILTYLIPAGAFERTVNETGHNIVVPGTFHYIDQTPVNILVILDYIYSGMSNAINIIITLLLSGGSLGIVLSTNMFQGAAYSLSQRVKGKEWIVIAVVTTVFALLSIPINLNIFIPFAALGIVIAKSLGFDEVVGVSMIMLGGAVGFSTGAMNLSNTGTAQSIAELPIFSGIEFRLFSIIPFLIITILYIVRYAYKIKKDPEKSYMYGIETDSIDVNEEDFKSFNKRHIPVAIVVAIAFGTMIYVAVTSELSFHNSSTIFLYMGILSGIVYRMSPNKIANSFVDGVKSMAPTAALIGFAYAISGILAAGNIMDTVVYFLANSLGYFPKLLQAPAMFIMQIVINFFITSGSGQAAVSMPIFIPVADLVDISRQTAVLAFNFGDGFSNFIFPHAAATVGFVGQAGIPYTKWFKFVIKLFVYWVIIGILLLMLATVIGY